MTGPATPVLAGCAVLSLAQSGWQMLVWVLPLVALGACIPSVANEKATNSRFSSAKSYVSTFDVSQLLPGNGGDGSKGFIVLDSVPGNRVGQSVAAGDLNGDGIADLAVVTWNVNYNGITILPSLGNGRFGPGVQTAAINGATSVATADFNGDGNLDLAVTCNSGVTILLGNGNGTFTALPAMAADMAPAP